MTEKQLPQLPQEKEDECPVCGEMFFRYEFTKEAECKEATVPFCVKTDGNGPFGVYYHA